MQENLQGRPNYEMYVISNTHWDREWSANFQETRMRLVSFVDDLLDILDTKPMYQSFVLDSQGLFRFER